MVESGAKEFFRLTKWKIIIAVLIPIIFAVLGVLDVLYLQYVVYPTNRWPPLIPINNQNASTLSPGIIMLAIVGFLLFAALSYPFSCSLLAIWNRYKHQNPKQLKGAFLALTLIGIIIFNPLGARIISVLTTGGIYALYFNSAYAPCGITFSSIIPNTPAEKAGLTAHQIISNVNGIITIQNLNDFKNFVANSKPGDNVTILTTDGKSYQLTLIQNPSTGSAMLGIANVQTGYCKK